jgi:hypothetical protein
MVNEPGAIVRAAAGWSAGSGEFEAIGGAAPWPPAELGGGRGFRARF